LISGVPTTEVGAARSQEYLKTARTGPEGGGALWSEGAATGWCGGAWRQHRVEIWQRRFVPMLCCGAVDSGKREIGTKLQK
jgi:hypothetical protein